MRERDVERRLESLARRHGGVCWKWESPVAGVPDRILILPGGRVVFVEVKRPGGRTRPVQDAIIRRMRGLGADVRIVDDADGLFSQLDSEFSTNRERA